MTSRDHSVRLKVSSTKQLSNPMPERRTKGPPGPAPMRPAAPAGLTLGHVAGEPACYIVTLQRKALAPSAPDSTPCLRPQPHVAGVGRVRRRTASARAWIYSQGSGALGFRVRLHMRAPNSAHSVACRSTRCRGWPGAAPFSGFLSLCEVRLSNLKIFSF